MPNRPNGSVAVKKKLESALPLEELDLTLFFTDTSKFFITNKDKTLKQITDVYTGFENLADLKLRGLKVKNKLYLTSSGALYIYNGLEYQSISSGADKELLLNEF